MLSKTRSLFGEQIFSFPVFKQEEQKFTWKQKVNKLLTQSKQNTSSWNHSTFDGVTTPKIRLNNIDTNQLKSFFKIGKSSQRQKCFANSYFINPFQTQQSRKFNKPSGYYTTHFLPRAELESTSWENQRYIEYDWGLFTISFNFSSCRLKQLGATDYGAGNYKHKAFNVCKMISKALLGKHKRRKRYTQYERNTDPAVGRAVASERENKLNGKKDS